METVKIMVNGEEQELVVKLDEETRNDDGLFVPEKENDIDLEDTLDLSNELENTMEVDINE